MLVGALVLSTHRLDPHILLLGAIGCALVVAALVGRAAPWRTPVATLVLVTTIAVVHVPRELDWMGATSVNSSASPSAAPAMASSSSRRTARPTSPG